MARPVSVDDWIEIEAQDTPDGSWMTMMSRVASFHHKHAFASEENHGHDMGYRVALTVEELGEFAAAITKGKPDEEALQALKQRLAEHYGRSIDMELHENADLLVGIRITVGDDVYEDSAATRLRPLARALT